MNLGEAHSAASQPDLRLQEGARCFAQGGATMGAVQRPWVIATTGRLGMDVSGIRIASAPPGPVSCGTR